MKYFIIKITANNLWIEILIRNRILKKDLLKMRNVMIRDIIQHNCYFQFKDWVLLLKLII